MEYFFKAIEFAARAHHEQRRKASTDPYFAHPLRVGYLAVDAGLSEDACVAAVLHDVVEDCDVDISKIYSEFPYEVGRIVSRLSKWWDDDASPEDKKLFMVEYYDIVLSHTDAVNIKLLDRIDNLRDMLLLLPQKRKWVEKYLDKTKKEFPRLYAASDNQIIKTAYDGIIELVEKRLKELNADYIK